MIVRQPRYGKEEFARRGDEIYETQVRHQVEEGNHGKIVAIDIETGVFEVDASEVAGGHPTDHSNLLDRISVTRSFCSSMVRICFWWWFCLYTASLSPPYPHLRRHSALELRQISQLLR